MNKQPRKSKAIAVLKDLFKQMLGVHPIASTWSAWHMAYDIWYIATREDQHLLCTLWLIRLCSNGSQVQQPNVSTLTMLYDSCRQEQIWSTNPYPSTTHHYIVITATRAGYVHKCSLFPWFSSAHTSTDSIFTTRQARLSGSGQCTRTHAHKHPKGQIKTSKRWSG